MQSYLDALSTTALLGTEKKQLPDLPETLQRMLEPEPGLEAQVLLATAAAQLYLRAAKEANHNFRLRIAPAGPEKQAEISGQAANYLAQFVQGRQVDLLQEFLAEVQRQKKRLPFYYLPELLELARMHNQLREPIRLTIGERGQWLAAQNSLWAFALKGDDSLERFETGSLTERLIAFKAMRQIEPHEARLKLEKDWKQNSAKDRAALIDALAEKLSLADEAFLEEALQDRSLGVRAAAAELLSQLPDSAYARRMQLRAKDLISYKPAGLLGLKTARLDLNLPDAPETEVDGIEVPGVVRGMGKKAWWFKQIGARVPLSVWPSDVTKMLEVARKEDRELLLETFVEASVRFKDAEAARKLIEFDVKATYLSRLLPLIPQKDAANLALELLNRFPELSYQHPLIQLMRLHPIYDLEGFGTKLKDSFKTSLQSKNAWEVKRIFESFAGLIPLDQRKIFAELLPQDPNHPHWGSYKYFLATLELRAAMLSALKET